MKSLLKFKFIIIFHLSVKYFIQFALKKNYKKKVKNTIRLCKKGSKATHCKNYETPLF